MTSASTRSYTPKLDKPVLLLVEGANAFYFLKSLFLSRPEFHDIFAYDFGSISQLKLQMETIAKAPSFRRFTKAVGVVRDAELDPSSAIDSIRGAYRSAGMSEPKVDGCVLPGSPATGFFLFPGNGGSGCLENACLGAYRNQPELDCAKGFLICAGRAARNANWQAKAVVHALIAISDKPEMTLGESARAGLWDPTVPELAAAEKFLKELCNSAKPQAGGELKY